MFARGTQRCVTCPNRLSRADARNQGSRTEPDEVIEISSDSEDDTDDDDSDIEIIGPTGDQASRPTTVYVVWWGEVSSWRIPWGGRLIPRL